MKKLLVLLLLLPATSSFACDCSDIYRTVIDAVCFAEDRGQIVMEIRIEAVNDRGAAAIIERVLVGQTEVREVFIANTSPGNCGYIASDLPVGNRYLLLKFLREEDSELRGFRCFFSGDIYELNEDKTQINYLIRGNEFLENQFEVDGLAWQDYPYRFSNPSCNLPGGLDRSNPDDLILHPNPGNGQFSFTLANNDRLLGNFEVAVYNLLGQRIVTLELDNANPTLDLTYLARGGISGIHQERNKRKNH